MKAWKATVIIVLIVLTIVCGIVSAERVPNARDQQAITRESDKAQPSLPGGLITYNKSFAGVTNNTLVAKIVGAGISYSNISYRGTKGSAGLFYNGTPILGIPYGVILSSGEIQDVIGPNNWDSISTNNGLAGDADLDKLIPGYTTYDATVIEFDFVPKTNVIKIMYVFSSDEYNEYVGTNYNDVFGFYVNGKNIAKLPDATNVSINNINLGSHAAYYRNNDWGDLYPGPYPINTEMDGVTTVITSMVSVKPNKLNHMKIAIADAGDHIYDSNVFIKVDSMSTYTGPVIYSIVPTSGTVGASKLLVKVNGDNFYPNTTFTLRRGPSALVVTDVKYLSKTLKTINVTIPWLSPAGTYNLTVRNFDGQTYQATNIFTAKNPVPVITAIVPASKAHGTAGFTLNVTGSKFVPTSKVRWNNVNKVTTYISPTKVSAAIPATDIATAGTRKVTVFNPTPGGGLSNYKNFTVT
jgi:hypothetical protein